MSGLLTGVDLTDTLAFAGGEPTFSVLTSTAARAGVATGFASVPGLIAYT